MPTRLLIALLALVVVTVSATRLHGTHAAFTDSETKSIAVSTGSVALERDGDGLVFSSAPLAPGDEVKGTVKVTNSGTLPAGFTLAREQLQSTRPAGCAVRDALRLAVVQVEGKTRKTLADGALADVDEALALGTFAAGESRTYEIVVTFASLHGATATDNDNCFQGSVDSERFSWQAMEAQA